MTAKLLIREVGGREFVPATPCDFEDAPITHPMVGNIAIFPGCGWAGSHGEELTIKGNVEAFEVWVRVEAKQRVWRLEDIA